MTTRHTLSDTDNNAHAHLDTYAKYNLGFFWFSRAQVFGGSVDHLPDTVGREAGHHKGHLRKNGEGELVLCGHGSRKCDGAYL